MVFRSPRVTIPNAQIGQETVTGEFVFPDDVDYEFQIETDALFQSSGAGAALSQVVTGYFEDQDPDLGEGVRQSLSLDVGMGRHVITIDFSSSEGSAFQWGDGSGVPTRDATDSDVHHQAAVFDKYLNTATLDSTNPAVLQLGEYHEDGIYGPINVVPRNPDIRFSSRDQSSVIDGSIDWVETQALAEKESDQPSR